MKKIILSLVISLLYLVSVQGQTLIKLKQLERAAGSGSTVVTNSLGILTYAPISGTSNSWLLDGNAVTTNTNFIGSTTNFDFNFRTNNQQRLKITNTGAFQFYPLSGATPTAQGSLYFDPVTNGLSLVTPTANTNWHFSVISGARVGSLYTDNSTLYKGFWVGTSTNDHVHFYVNGNGGNTPAMSLVSNTNIANGALIIGSGTSRNYTTDATCEVLSGQGPFAFKVTRINAVPSVTDNILTVAPSGSTTLTGTLNVRGPITTTGNVNVTGVTTLSNVVANNLTANNITSNASLISSNLIDPGGYTDIFMNSSSGVLRYNAGDVLNWGSSGVIIPIITGNTSFANNTAFSGSIGVVGNTTLTTVSASNGTVTQKMYVGGTGVTATADLHLAAGTTAPGTAPEKYTSGPLMTTPEVGAEEFLTDKRHFTISTGTQRVEYTFNNIALTSGRVPFATTNGRLTDVAAFTFSGTRLSPNYITLAAGAAGAGNAPLVMTTGPVLTTKIAGAWGYTTPKLFFTNGLLLEQEIPQIQQSRVTANFNATSNTVLANITGLSANVAATGTYKFKAILFTTSDVTAGVKFSIAGTAVATSIVYETLVTNAGAITQTRGTALAATVGAVTAVTAAYCVIEGIITVTTAGTLTVQFAQNVSNAVSSVVLAGSSFELQQI